MKKILNITLLVASIFIVTTLQAQSLDGVVTGIKNGNATQVTDNAGESFSLTIRDKSSNYAKADALKAIKDFFTNNTVKAFDIKHKGNSPNGQYAIGTLSSSTGNYRVNIFMKKEGGKEVIKELRIQLIE